jgi:hypothetical protein
MKRMLLLVSMLIWVGTAGAQESPKAELFGGFSYSRGQYDMNMVGWNVSLAGVANKWFSFVGDLSANYGSPKYGSDFTMVSIAGGPQFSLRRGAVTPFARFLVGANRLSSGGQSETDLSLILGGGVDIAVNKRLAIRALQADFMYIRTGNRFVAGIYQGRLSSGLVVRF